MKKLLNKIENFIVCLLIGSKVEFKLNDPHPGFRDAKTDLKRMIADCESRQDIDKCWVAYNEFEKNYNNHPGIVLILAELRRSIYEKGLSVLFKQSKVQ